MLKDLKKAMMGQAMKVMMDPRMMKLMSNPKVMSFMMQSLQFRSKVSALWSARTRAWAEQFNLVSRQELEEMRAELEDLRSRMNE